MRTPVRIKGTADCQRRYDQGVHAFFDIAQAFAVTGPRVTAEPRQAVGR